MWPLTHPQSRLRGRSGRRSHSCPISAPGESHPGGGTRQGGPPGGGFLGSAKACSAGEGRGSGGGGGGTEGGCAGFARAICSPSRSSKLVGTFCPLASSLRLSWPSRPRVDATPWAAGLVPQSHPGTPPASSFCELSAPRPSLPPCAALLRASRGGCMSWHRRLALAHGQARERAAHPPPRTAPRRPGSRGPAGSAPAAALRAPLPGAAHKDGLPGPEPAGFRSSGPSPPPQSPGAPSAGGETLSPPGKYRRPRTRTRAQVPVNAQGEGVPGEFGRYLKDRQPAAPSASFGLFPSEGKERGAGQTPPAEAASCSRHPRLSQAVVLNEQ
ncbi:collagen alpha-1(I) chain-like [Myotis daubentonii]|uniref:collagen alpha-1(I) chain-like n=1 Tax=Myotis daubentonii TaxID=98922 RepID=UPI002873DFEB|nr:collagen alpha-1(I) chain-like [Myotis daubentonii]